ncbi:Prolyl 4-hydroxylase subunit alpha-3 [Dissostichus eleginoides]|uniref:Prolyl 4-hydroxylase subunit alpha-3 n=1 Tax=Dissostichus eleginoides TaxID=100907 RepID=A0AAD9CI85_DISEL|nr:Prolyl 4-hydroxylase subunit alpha-3 [Dissostichus eleginoides]
MYTSLLNVKQAISVERKLINYLKTYIDHESERLEDVKRFYAKVSDLHTELYKGPATVMANPLVAFTLIKRLHSESSYEKEEADLPKLEDLQGAAKGLMRLQDVYVLQVASLVRGLFQRVTEGQPIDIYRPAVSVPLSGDDCFLGGKVAYEQQDYYHSVQWLEESVRLFRGAGGEWIPENAGTLEDALDHLAFSHFKITLRFLICNSFYAKVSDLHTELYKGPATAMANPLVAFTLIKRLHSEWLNVVHSNEAQENTQGWLSAFFTDTSGGDNAPYSSSQLSPPNPPNSPFGPLL